MFRSLLFLVSAIVAGSGLQLHKGAKGKFHAAQPQFTHHTDLSPHQVTVIVDELTLSAIDEFDLLVRETKMSRGRTTAASDAINSGFRVWIRDATAAAMDVLNTTMDSGDSNPEQWDQWDRTVPGGVQSAGIQKEYKRLVIGLSKGLKKALALLRLRPGLEYMKAFIDCATRTFRGREGSARLQKTFDKERAHAGSLNLGDSRVSVASDRVERLERTQRQDYATSDAAEARHNQHLFVLQARQAKNEMAAYRAEAAIIMGVNSKPGHLGGGATSKAHTKAKLEKRGNQVDVVETCQDDKGAVWGNNMNCMRMSQRPKSSLKKLCASGAPAGRYCYKTCQTGPCDEVYIHEEQRALNVSQGLPCFFRNGTAMHLPKLKTEYSAKRQRRVLKALKAKADALKADAESRKASWAKGPRGPSGVLLAPLLNRTAGGGDYTAEPHQYAVKDNHYDSGDWTGNHEAENSLAVEKELDEAEGIMGKKPPPVKHNWTAADELKQLDEEERLNELAEHLAEHGGGSDHGSGSGGSDGGGGGGGGGGEAKTEADREMQEEEAAEKESEAAAKVEAREAAEDDEADQQELDDEDDADISYHKKLI